MLMCTFVLNLELLNPIRFELCLLLGIVFLFVFGVIIYGFFRENAIYRICGIEILFESNGNIICPYFDYDASTIDNCYV